MYNNKYYVQYTDTCKIELNPNYGHWIFVEIIYVCACFKRFGCIRETETSGN